MVVDDPSVTAGVLAAVVIQSLTAVQDLPVEHTLRIKGTLTFSGDRTLPLDMEMPQGGARGVAFAILPYVNAMMQNNFTSLELKEADLSVVVNEGIRELVVQSATLDRATAHPGDTVKVAVALSRYQEPEVIRHLELNLPSDLAEGEYDVMITDVGGHLARMMMSNPDLARVDDIDGLFRTIAALAGADGNTLYAAIARPVPGVAVNDQAMPTLPGSRAALLGAASNTRVSAYPRFVEASVPLDEPVLGVLTLPLVVQAQP